MKGKYKQKCKEKNTAKCSDVNNTQYAFIKCFQQKRSLIYLPCVFCLLERCVYGCETFSMCDGIFFLHANIIKVHTLM